MLSVVTLFGPQPENVKSPELDLKISSFKVTRTDCQYLGNIFILEATARMSQSFHGCSANIIVQSLGRCGPAAGYETIGGAENQTTLDILHLDYPT